MTVNGMVVRIEERRSRRRSRLDPGETLMSTAPGPSLQPDQPPESPVAPVDQRIGWGSDVAAQMLRRLDIPFIAMTPGASYRGLHDSLVNHLGNEMPKMLLCLHEEHAVAIAHGYAKASGRAMAVALHSNVGLMHGSMAIFNAWCDRQPMLIVGATGPVDAAQRRPWIDWVHTAQDQGALIRNFIKWDDQPGSAAAMPESFLRAWQLAATPPCGPVYVCLDATLQERPLDGDPTFPDPARFRPPPPAVADTAAIEAAAGMLAGAERPLILFGRGERTSEAWQCRVGLAERLGAAMLSDLKAGSMVPSDHPQHAGPPFNRLSRTARKAIVEADVILSLGWIDLGGLLNQAFDRDPPSAKIIHAGQDSYLHGGWGKEHGVLPPVDVYLLGDSDRAAAALLSRLADTPPKAPWFTAIDNNKTGTETGDRPTMRDLALELTAAAGVQPVAFAALPRGWPVALAPHRDPLAYLGKDGGGGVGSGPGLTIGAALALRDSGRLVVGVLGDGDCMMSINALWTAARYRIPALFVVANNRAYFNDEVHQENVARARSRNLENKHIGIAIDQPAPDFARLAEAQGVDAVGPVASRHMLPDALSTAVDALRAGKPFLVDVHI
jgi:thiamine pyrophosphate-dependent acetolactate synthase large subunit-like protein